MDTMNDRIRRAVRVSLAERDMTQADLARLIEMKPQYMSELLTGKTGKIPNAWQRILDALGLELVAVPKVAARGFSTAFGSAFAGGLGSPQSAPDVLGDEDESGS